MELVENQPVPWACTSQSKWIERLGFRYLYGKYTCMCHISDFLRVKVTFLRSFIALVEKLSCNSETDGRRAKLNQMKICSRPEVCLLECF